MSFHNMGYYVYPEDMILLEDLGLSRHQPVRREWQEWGTVEIEFSDDQIATVKIEASALPAMFFRFTIKRPHYSIKLGRYYFKPRTLVMTTGSGKLVDYWPIAKMMAEGMLEIE